MQSKIYQWAGLAPTAEAADWFSVSKGVFSQDGPAVLGSAPAYSIWSGVAAIASSSSCRQAALVRMPRPIEGRLLDHLGLRFILAGAMIVGEEPDTEIAYAGDGLLIDLNQPARIEYAAEDDNTTELTLWAPRASIASGQTHSGHLHGHVFRNADPGIAVLSAAARALHAELDHLASGDIDRLVGGIWDLAARLLPDPGVSS